MKGQNKIKRGSGFRGVLAYVLDHDDPEHVGGTLPFGTLNQMTSEFVALSSTRNDIEKPVWHNSLRLPADEHISNEVWQKIATDYMKQLGFDNAAQWIAFKHNKDDGEHIHIIANRILPSGSIYLGQNENLKSTAIIAELERQYELIITKSVDLDNNNKIIIKERSNMKKNEQEKMKRTGQLSERMQLQAIIDKAINDNPTIAEFVEHLNSVGVIATPNVAKTGRMNGFSFRIGNGNLVFSGSKLGRKYTWSNLLQAGLQYDSDSDALFLSQLKQKLQQVVNNNGEEANIIVPTQSPTDIDEMDDEEKQQLERQIEEFYERKNQQYFCLKTGQLAFTEEADRIVCHITTPEAISAQTKLAKIKFGNEFISRGSEQYRRESWLQASLQGCLDHGYEASQKDILELKRRLEEYRELNNKSAVLHSKIADLVNEDGSTIERHLEMSESQLNLNKTTIKDKEDELSLLFSKRKTLQTEHPQITEADKKEIKKQAYLNVIPKNKREQIIIARKRLRQLKAELEKDNGFLKRRKLKNKVQSAETELNDAKGDIATSEFNSRRKDEISRLTKEAENYYSQLKTRNLMTIQGIDDRINVITPELKELEQTNLNFINKAHTTNENNQPELLDDN